MSFSRIAALVLVGLAIGHLSSPLQAAQSDIDRGLRAMRRGQVEAAIDLWTRAIKKNPKSYAAHVNRGSAYLLRGYVLRGIRDWYEAETLCPLFAYAVFDGEFIPEAARNVEMLSYAAAIEIDPDHLTSVAMMAVTYLDLGLPERAAELYRKSIELTKNPLLKSKFDHWLGTIEE